MRKLTVVVLAVLTLVACNGGVGSSTDATRASSCADLADVAINQLQVFVDEVVGDRSYEEFVEAYDADGGEAFAAATEVYSEGNMAVDARQTQLDCGVEFQDLICDRLDRVEGGGTGADQLLAPSREACG